VPAAWGASAAATALKSRLSVCFGAAVASAGAPACAAVCGLPSRSRPPFTSSPLRAEPVAAATAEAAAESPGTCDAEKSAACNRRRASSALGAKGVGAAVFSLMSSGWLPELCFAVSGAKPQASRESKSFPTTAVYTFFWF